MYCCPRGASSPYWWRKAARSDAVAPSPSICCTGSPGTRWMSKKTIDTTSQMTGRIYSNRLSSATNSTSLPPFPAGLAVSLGPRDHVRLHPSRVLGAAVFCIVRLVLQPFYAHPADAMIVHFQYRKPSPLKIHGLFARRALSQPGKQKPSKCFHSAAPGQMPVHLSLQVAQVHAAIQHHGAGGGLQSGPGTNVKFVFYLSDD